MSYSLSFGKVFSTGVLGKALKVITWIKPTEDSAERKDLRLAGTTMLLFIFPAAP